MSDFGLLIEDDFLDKDYFLNSEISVSKKEDKSTERKIRIIKIIFFVLCIFLTGELLMYKFVKPSFASPKVTLTGTQNYSPKEIASLLNSMNVSNWFNFDVEKAVSIISSQSWVNDVSVEKRFPDKIFIKVEERIPVALTFVSTNGRTIPVQIDKSGVLFPIKENSSDFYEKLPIISGLPIEYVSNGMRIPKSYKTLIEQIVKIKQLPQNYFAGISEICVLPNDYGNYELALIPSQSKIKVLTDRALNEEALKYMMIVLDVVKQLDDKVSEVDLRYGSVSYKINEKEMMTFEQF